MVEAASIIRFKPDPLDIFKANKPATPMQPLDRSRWQRLVTLQSNDITLHKVMRANALGQSFLRSGKLRNGLAQQPLLAEIFREQLRMVNLPEVDQISGRHFDRKVHCFAELAKDTMRHNPRKILADMIETLFVPNRNLIEVADGLYPEQAEKQSKVLANVLRFGIITLYLMMGSSQRFIVGTHGDLQFKDVKIPLLEGESIEESAPLMYLGTNYLNGINLIGKEDLPAVPEMLIHPRQLHLLQLPTLPASMIEWLQSAYFNGHFAFPIPGARIGLRNCGDVRGMYLIQEADLLIANVDTKWGQSSVIINIKSGNVVEPQRVIFTEESDDEYQPSRVATLVAVSFHNAVVAKAVSAKSYREMVLPKTIRWKRPDQVGKLPEATLIPRTYRIDNGNGRVEREPNPNPRYIEPHHVSAHPRRTKNGMSYAQRIKYEAWKKMYGRELNLKPTDTAVLPHVSPKSAEKGMEDWPQYVWDGLKV